ncbi:MAG: hypothetical protein LBS55_11920 [Prevotellaceae bacterium]|jgi:hypothetical protein|nr:hypothetical protein [Prevotellaceae bacterium]
MNNPKQTIGKARGSLSELRSSSTLSVLMSVVVLFRTALAYMRLFILNA